MKRIDTRTETWERVSEWARAELTHARDLLERETTQAEETIALRARIRLLKRLLELPTQTAPTTEPEVAFGIDAPVS